MSEKQQHNVALVGDALDAPKGTQSVENGFYKGQAASETVIPSVEVAFDMGQAKACDTRVEDEGDPTGTIQKRSLPVSSFVHTMRMQKGMRHEDAQRYRLYCSKRLLRIRDKLKFKQTASRNGRFTHRPLPKVMTDDRYLHIPLICAERCWAFHLQLKNMATALSVTGGQGVDAVSRARHMSSSANLKSKKPADLRRLATRKLAKAVKYATALTELAKRHCNRIGILEAMAYRAFLHGAYLTEARRWRVAGEELYQARKLYLQLQRVMTDEGVGAIAVSAQLSLIDAYLRTVAYYLARLGVDLTRVAAGDAGVQQEGRIAEETQKQCASSGTLEEVPWLGTGVMLDTMLLEKSHFSSVYEAVAKHLPDVVDLKSVEVSEFPFSKLRRRAASGFGTASELWAQVLDSYQIAQKSTEKSLAFVHESLLQAASPSTTPDDGTVMEVSEEMTQTSQFFVLENLTRDWQKLLGFEMHVVLFILFWEHHFAHGQEGRYDTSHSLPPTMGDTLSVDLLCSAAFIVTLADVALQLLKSIRNDIRSARYPAELSSVAAPGKALLQGKVTRWEQALRDCRAAALCLALKDSDKAREAFVLMGRLVERREELKAQEAAHGGRSQDITSVTLPDTAAWADSPFFRVGHCVRRLEAALSKGLPVLSIHVSASLLLASSTLTSGTGASHEDHDVQVALTQRSVQDMAGKLNELLQFKNPPPLEPIPVKPIFYDVAFSTIPQPIVDRFDGGKEKAGTENAPPSGGILGRITGWWR